MAKKQSNVEGAEGKLDVGYAKREITPPLGGPLAGVVTRKGRSSERVRDPLFVRAIHLKCGGSEATLVTADILVITQALHQRASEFARVTPDKLLLSATHTHSGPGGYWNGGRVRFFMGPFAESTLEWLAREIGQAVLEARSQLKPARMKAARKELIGVNLNRRRQYGPVDPELSLVEFDVEKDKPIIVVCFGAHPVIGSEREIGTITADFPGEICRRLERHGYRSAFFQGAVAGVSPLFPEFPIRLDQHLDLVGGLLENGVLALADSLKPMAHGPVTSRIFRAPFQGIACRIFPSTLRANWLYEQVATPLRGFMEKMGTDGKAEDPSAPLHLLRVGDVAWLGTPCDLGPSVSQSLKVILAGSGVKQSQVGSQCDGYVGYVHLRDEYDHVPEKGFRIMNYYENAMSLSGWAMGDAFLSTLQEQLPKVTQAETREKSARVFVN